MSQFPEKPSVAEAADLIQRLGGRPPRYRIKTAIAKAARRLGWKQSRAKAVWYAEALVSPEELEALRAMSADTRSTIDNAEARHELAALKVRIARLERLLDATAPPARSRPLSTLGRLLGRVGL